jgi:hypothetical protein
MSFQAVTGLTPVCNNDQIEFGYVIKWVCLLVQG